MKRSREVAIVIESLVREGLLDEKKTDRAQHVVKEAFKKIRCEMHSERKAR